ncbi:hypothetical protein GW17_00056335 [Ensete ventricosum]|nr:hypothetical protein GW17_00056335 [Ensete ventricosum]RZS24286.1 hypothetical protein BHM03_00057337 [Ensete ventricosum]
MKVVSGCWMALASKGLCVAEGLGCCDHCNPLGVVDEGGQWLRDGAGDWFVQGWLHGLGEEVVAEIGNSGVRIRCGSNGDRLWNNDGKAENRSSNSR